jgi:release factor glutamine methyltransferase
MAPALHERIAGARATLEKAGITPEDAAVDAEVLARHVLGWDRARLVTGGRDRPPDGFDRAFDACIARRTAREPVALITGHREFWRLDFEVTPDTLIPRPETELIVEEALAAFGHRPPAVVIDVGTGSGCLAVCLAREFRHARVIATDVSDAALRVAERNAVRHGVEVLWVRTTLLDDVDASADLIVSNPPYVPDAAAGTLPPEVLEYEPHGALFGGPDGLAVVRTLFSDARSRLAPGGRLIVEFGFGQEAEVRALAGQAGWHIERVRQDLQGIPRTIVLRR